MAELSDGKLLDDRTSLKSLCSVVREQEDAIEEKTVQISDRMVETVHLQSSQADSSARATEASTNTTANAVDSRCCFRCGRTATENSCDDSGAVGTSSTRHVKRDSRQEPGADADDINSIHSTFMSNTEATSIRTGVSRTPQVAAVIAMAGRRGRRRLGELFHTVDAISMMAVFHVTPLFFMATLLQMAAVFLMATVSHLTVSHGGSVSRSDSVSPG